LKVDVVCYDVLIEIIAGLEVFSRLVNINLKVPDIDTDKWGFFSVFKHLK